MNSLITFAAVLATASAVTPFFESPHNPRAVPFYKVPINQDYSSPSAYNKPSPSFKSAGSFAPSSYSPSFSPYKQESFGEDFYKPEPSFYKSEPSFYKPESSPYQPSYGGQGASSFQTIRIGGGNQGYSQFRPRY